VWLLLQLLQHAASQLRAGHSNATAAHAKTAICAHTKLQPAAAGYSPQHKSKGMVNLQQLQQVCQRHVPGQKKQKLACVTLAM
jgi:hypothetical protein